MKRLQPTEYTYASARIRALENRIVGRERMEILIETRTASEVMDRLAEYGIKPAETEGITPVGDSVSATQETVSAAREAMLLEVLREAYSEAEAAVPNPSLLRYFRYPYDCNNLKAAVKCAVRGISPAGMLFDFGTVPADRVESLLREEAYSDLPPAMAAALPAARAAFDRTADPRRIDALLDAACYADMLNAARETGEETLVSWVRTKMDLTNIVTTLRILRMGTGSVGAAFLSESLLEGGTLEPAFFTQAYEGGETRLWEALSPTPYCRLAQVEGDPRPLFAVEKACDDLYTEQVRGDARIPFGAPVVGGYLVGWETAVKNIRIVLAAKEAGLSSETLRERIRVSYV